MRRVEKCTEEDDEVNTDNGTVGSNRGRNEGDVAQYKVAQLQPYLGLALEPPRLPLPIQQHDLLHTHHFRESGGTMPRGVIRIGFHTEDIPLTLRRPTYLPSL